MASYTTDTVNIYIIQNALGRFNINYTEHKTNVGYLYFCTLPNNLTFDLFSDNDGTIKLWRFIEREKSDELKFLCKYKSVKYPYSEISLNTTDDGDLNLCATQKFSFNDSQSTEGLYKMIKSYSKIITAICL